MENTPDWQASLARLDDPSACPACLVTLTGLICGSCGLNLGDRRAPDVLAAGRAMVSWENERQRLIGEIRTSSERATAEVRAARIRALGMPEVSDAEAQPAPAPVLTPVESWVTNKAAPEFYSQPGATSSPDTEPFTEPFVAPAPREARPPRRRLSVQALLLIVGVSLVSIAAIFFVIFAWFVAGVGVRALIVGAVTVAIISAASLLRRRSLTSTAEGIATLGVVLLGLDAWAAHANNLFGLGQLDPVVYSGIAALIIAAGCRVWSLFSKLRAPDVAAAFATLGGIGLLIAGVSSLSGVAAAVAGLVGAAAGGLAHALPKPWSSARSGEEAVPERISLAAGGIGALVIAAVLAPFVNAFEVPVTAWATPLVVVIGIAHALALGWRKPSATSAVLPAAEIMGATAAATAVVGAGTLGWQLAWRLDSPLLGFLLAPAVAAAVWVLSDIARRHVDALTANEAPLVMRVASIAGAIVGAASIGGSLAMSLPRAIASVSLWTPWQTDTFAPFGDKTAWAAPIAAAVIVAALFVVRGPWLETLKSIRPGLAAVVVLAAGAAPGIPAVFMLAAIAVAAGSLVALARGHNRISWGTAAILGAIAAPFVGIANPWLWFVGVAVAVLTPITALLVTRVGGLSAVLLTLAPVVVATTAAILFPLPLGAMLGAKAPTDSMPVALQWVALATIAGATFLRIQPHTRPPLVIAGYAVFIASLVGIADSPATPGEPAGAVVRTALILAMSVMVLLRRSPIVGRAAHVATAGAGPAAAALSVAIFNAIDPPSADHKVQIAMAAAALVAVGVALAVAFGHRVHARMGADIGVLSAVAILLVPAPPDDYGTVFVIVAAAVAAASVAPGWSAPRALALPGVFTSPAEGVLFAGAPRRVLMWPAAGFATLALWMWLGGTDSGIPPVDVFLLPPAIAMAVWATLLVWLRRFYEATIAAVLSGGVALVVPTILSYNGLTSSRELITAAVAAAICVLVTWSLIARATAPAVAAAVTSLFAIGMVLFEHVVAWPFQRPDALAPITVVLLIGFPAVAFGAALGALRLRQSTVAPLWRGFAASAPALVLLATAVATIPSARYIGVVYVAFGILAALHWGAAAFNRDPLGASTRWGALLSAAIVAAAALVLLPNTTIEVLTLPLAAMLLGGAALGIWRSARTPGAEHNEQSAWATGLVVGFAPTLVTEWSDTRAWIVIAVGLAVAGYAVFGRLPSHLSERTIIIGSAAALLMGVRAALDTWVGTVGPIMALVAALGVLAVAAAVTARAEAGVHRQLVTLLSGGALTTLAIAAMMGPQNTSLTAITIGVAGVLAVGGASAMAVKRWWHLGATVAVGGSVLAMLAALRSTGGYLAWNQGSLEPDVWMLAATLIVFAAGLAALKASDHPRVSLVASVGMCVALVVFATMEYVLPTRQPLTEFSDLRVVLAMVVLTGAGVLGEVLRRRLGRALFLTASATVAAFGALALTSLNFDRVELVTLPPAVGLLLIGAWRLRKDAAVRSWPALGPGLALLLVPSLLMDFAPGELWRVIGLGVVALAVIVVGAMTRLQAPLVAGSIVLLIHGVAQLWPWIVDAYLFVPWWLWLGVGGSLLIFLAARYEKQARALRTAFEAVTSLR